MIDYHPNIREAVTLEIERPERKGMLKGAPLTLHEGTVVRGASGFIFLAGMTGVDLDTGEIPEGLEDQVKITWENVRQSLEKAGSSLDNICHSWYHVVASSPQEAMDALIPVVTKITDEFFREHSSLPYRPPGSGIGTIGLAIPELLVEITVIAAIP